MRAFGLTVTDRINEKYEMHSIGGSASLELNCHRAAGICTPQGYPFFDWPDLSPAIAPGTLLRYQRMSLPAFYRAKAWRILYLMRDYSDRPILSSGMASAHAPELNLVRVAAAAPQQTL